MPSKKKLYVVRHAKSSWDYENISDIDRPLKLRGIRNAYEMSRRLKINRNIPDKFISSPANRALHTASIFINVFEYSYENLKIDERLYGSGIDTILELIYNQPSNINKLAIFGHNPDFSSVARNFAKNPIYELPTCGVAIFTFDCKNWSEIGKGNLVAELFDFPKKE
jgi:phosphohistidine phosphatase